MAAARAATQVPDEEDFLDLVPWLNPSILPSLIDAGLLNETVENAIPDLIDEYPNIAVGNCSLNLSGPSLSPDGLRVLGSASMSCAAPQIVTKLVVCIQRRAGDRWHTLTESCRPATSANQAATTKRTSAVCTPGTWKYRLHAAAATVGSEINVAAIRNAGARITCHTLGL